MFKSSSRSSLTLKTDYFNCCQHCERVGPEVLLVSLSLPGSAGHIHNWPEADCLRERPERQSSRYHKLLVSCYTNDTLGGIRET